MSDPLKEALSKIDALFENPLPLPSPDLDQLLYQLACTVRDLERQESNEQRAMFYGECRGMLKAMTIARLLDDPERNQWVADIYGANLRAVEKCEAAGSPADDIEVRRHKFQLTRLARNQVFPRTSLPY
ncbi:hypothetical protein PsaNZ64_00360 [Pseudomonas syringae pv. actinidiae]|uniref:hypothetical protein n=1 Tax=Pseudomonas syringae group TaxID=136849 RepID=UPI0006B8F2AE|nr:MULTISPECIES: hypothetical protein [Pseudomonas syringae group]KPB36958.1 Uncharacterized protein AC516_4019 [Pseudomonas amygdali pv. sesami]OKS78768.1 hypothetical protein PsaNZ64_00360 [Pseudomonas syringae pv. actinidiae]